MLIGVEVILIDLLYYSELNAAFYFILSLEVLKKN